jgi:hypothetical protein
VVWPTFGHRFTTRMPAELQWRNHSFVLLPSYVFGTLCLLAMSVYWCIKATSLGIKLAAYASAMMTGRIMWLLWKVFHDQLEEHELKKALLQHDTLVRGLPVSADEEQCIICLEEHVGLRKLPCRHAYHHECLVEWFQAQNKKSPSHDSNNRSCPCCRRQVSEDSIASAREALTQVEAQRQVSKGSINWAQEALIEVNVESQGPVPSPREALMQVKTERQISQGYVPPTLDALIQVEAQPQVSQGSIDWAYEALIDVDVESQGSVAPPGEALMQVETERQVTQGSVAPPLEALMQVETERHVSQGCVPPTLESLIQVEADFLV